MVHYVEDIRFFVLNVDGPRCAQADVAKTANIIRSLRQFYLCRASSNLTQAYLS